jgi:hypothetical protein
MSNEPDPRRPLQFLCSPYRRVHFFLNRTQVSGSLFASDVRPFRTRHRYMRELIHFEEERLVLFDLHRFWSDTFRVQTDSGAELAVVSDTTGFAENTQRWLHRWFFPQVTRLKISMDRMAFRIPSNTTMQTLDADALSRHDPALAEHLQQRGILAVHPTDDSMGFLCDLEQLVRSRLLFATGEEDARP